MSKELIDKDVAAYLLANPDFFVDRDRLLLKIQVPHKSKGTISLVEKQLDVIRDRQRQPGDNLRNSLRTQSATRRYLIRVAS